ncbi:hypothetical protein CBER1_11638 [Cercospora berteroae]|uniref:Uncharacterized protein n=1 Tax=Cercospora berteroae TaxID=357750 RepID=A0A2S6CM83_9PEZI|nr:hypothetical protein CBER1_11638 [Cercospora berteroae]
MERLALAAINKVPYVAFGPAHCFVRPTGRGTRPVYLATKNCGNFLATISDAIVSYMVLHPFEESNFQIMLGAAVGGLIRYVGWSDQAAVPLEAHERTNDLEFQLDPHLHSQQLTYSELVMLLNKAAKKRRNELHSTHKVSQGKSPIYCFEAPHQLVRWLKEGPSRGDRGTTYFDTTPDAGLSGPVSAKDNSAPDIVLEGKDLVSKKRRLDWDYLSTSFYNPDQDTEEARLPSEESGAPDAATC